MKPSQPRIDAVKRVYEEYWESYLAGNVETFSTLVADEYSLIGTTEAEVFHTKAEAMEYVRATADQIAGKVEVRNRVLSMVSVNQLIIINEQADLYVLIDSDWTVYAKIRMSTLLHDAGKGWKVVHQHASLPDTRAEEGETIALDKIKTENLQLRDAVKRRTVQLEQKNNELLLESSLERVRTVAMGMRSAADLLSICEILFSELHTMGFSDLRNAMVNIHDDEKSSFLNYDYSNDGVKSITNFSYTIHPVIENMVRQVRSSHDAFSETTFSGKELEEWREFRKRNGERDDPKMDDISALYYYFYSIGNGAIGISTYSSISEEQRNVLKRFRNVFNLSYQRYTDISIAEAQAREARIETALERVRAVAMAMRKPGELAGIGETLFTELKVLDFADLRNTEIIINHDAKESITSYYYSDYGITGVIDVDYNTNPTLQTWAQQLRKADDAFAEIAIPENEMDAWRAYRVSLGYLPDPKLDAAKTVYYYSYSIGLGALSISTFKPVSADQLKILERFRNVFNLSYQRYADIALAEAQAKEAQIEVSLERVRSRSMAMHSSAELVDASDVLFHELKKLGIESIRSGIGLIDGINNTVEIWSRSEIKDRVENKILGRVPAGVHPVFDGLMEAWKGNRPYFSINLEGEGVKKYYDTLASHLSYPERREYNERETISCFLFAEGSLNVVSYGPLDEEGRGIMVRCARVFGQMYKRFLDLQKAEAQAREAQIEAGLERVRGRTLAMHSSDELAETAVVVFRQLINLGIEPNRLYIGIINDDSGDIEFWATEEDGSKIGNRITGNASANISMAKMYEGWKEHRTSTTIDMQGKELADYFQYLSGELHVPFQGGLSQKRRVQNIAYFSKGFIGIASPEPQPEETTTLLERFANVFNLTYTRFSDLQQAEAQTRKAQIEVALEKVRARALAMLQPEELVEVARALRREMGVLGVEELETSNILIHDQGSDNAECWYAMKDVRQSEKELVTGSMEMALKETWVGRQMLEFCNSTERQVSIRLEGDHGKEWDHYCSEHSKGAEAFRGADTHDQFYHLYRFANGAIIAATPGDISAESWELLSRAASVLSLAYSRFKDLTQARIDLHRLKEEKQRAETALTELKATQSQLIHAEKMASLGELTAGIAHEIQNPLNFVNNFSEVSDELIDEMTEELGKGNTEEVKTIASDVKQNLAKILHHGKRADAIVKGMLQHSRSSRGTKEPTNINALADEYFRLAYHGLRAKDKSFKATMKTEYEQNIENISIIPQDIGRVILNLITNAFYSVTEKSKRQAEGYEPTVTVSTKAIKATSAGAWVVVSVKDNGGGIPHKVLQRIFQPFFTTKPAGQGTGLGLSLSYDILKAHGGDLNVETKEGEGAEFIVRLPA